MTEDDAVAELLALSAGKTANGDTLPRALEIFEYIRESGLSDERTAELTVGLANSGDLCDWRTDPVLGKRVSVDLPSTGGVSNKTPLVAPLLALAATGDELFVPKVSTRGKPAGTIDILEAANYRAEVDQAEYRQILANIGISNILPEAGLAPADAGLMRLRRQAKAMAITELVIASILAKKVAAGCRTMVIDLKVGRDSKVGNIVQAYKAAERFVAVGRILQERGLLDALWITGTNTFQCQGRAIGRTAALWEIARILGGQERGFLAELCVALAARMIAVARRRGDIEEFERLCTGVKGPRVVDLTRRWLRAHGARTDFLADPDALLRTLSKVPFNSVAAGRLLSINTKSLGSIVENLAEKPNALYAAGIVFSKQPTEGSGLEPKLSGEVLMPPGFENLEPILLAELEAAVNAYAGDSPIIERPSIFFDVAQLHSGYFAQPVWTRSMVASIAIVRRGADARQILLVFNRKWNTWNLLSGKFETDLDADITGAAAREVCEELGDEINERPPQPGTDFTCRISGRHADLWYSESTKQWTLYDFHVVEARFQDTNYVEAIVVRHPLELLWAAIDEIKVGRTASGATITAFPAATFATEGSLEIPSGRIVRIGPEDKALHTAIFGATGVGKSTLMSSLAIEDIRQGCGACIVDPHGTVVEAVLKEIPFSRLNDVIVVDPSDTNASISLNPLEIKSEEDRHVVINEFIASVLRLNRDQWGEAGQHYVGPALVQHLSMAARLATHDLAKPPTLVELIQLFSDTSNAIKRWLPLSDPDPVLQDWVNNVLPHYDYRRQGDSISMGSYITSKFEPMISDPRVRAVFGQRRSSFDFLDVMNEGKILIVNLPKSALGELPARALAMIVMAKIYSAAMRRGVSTTRKPFHVYVDEYESVSSESAALMLSEVRKWGVSLTLAVQHWTQLDKRLQSAIAGNVGTVIAFRSAAEADQISSLLGGDINTNDIKSLPNYHAYVRTLVNGVPTGAFPIKTIRPNSKIDTATEAEVRAASAARYARPLAEVLKQIASDQLQETLHASEQSSEDQRTGIKQAVAGFVGAVKAKERTDILHWLGADAQLVHKRKSLSFAGLLEPVTSYCAGQESFIIDSPRQEIKVEGNIAYVGIWWDVRRSNLGRKNRKSRYHDVTVWVYQGRIKEWQLTRGTVSPLFLRPSPIQIQLLAL